MKTKTITDILEQVAELGWQESYDNAGLIVGDSEGEVESALLCVDITEQVLDEALELGAGLIISHHPIIFHPIKRITGSTYIERVVEKAVKHDVALYACHTNLDSAPKVGINHRLGQLLSLRETGLLESARADNPDVGIGIVGEFERPLETGEFLERLKSVLNLKSMRYSTPYKTEIKRVAICSGSGASLMPAAKAKGADAYVSADFKYNDFLDADRELVIADVGHFESEYCAIDILFDVITKKISTFAIHKSKCSRNPINYLV